MYQLANENGEIILYFTMPTDTKSKLKILRLWGG